MEITDAQILLARVGFVPTRDTKKKTTSNEMASSLGLYVTRWQRWAVAGLLGISFKLYGDRPGTFKNLQYQPISIPVNWQVITQRHRNIN
jgi:hypothetical protein